MSNHVRNSKFFMFDDCNYNVVQLDVEFIIYGIVSLFM